MYSVYYRPQVFWTECCNGEREMTNVWCLRRIELISFPAYLLTANIRIKPSVGWARWRGPSNTAPSPPPGGGHQCRNNTSCLMKRISLSLWKIRKGLKRIQPLTENKQNCLSFCRTLWIKTSGGLTTEYFSCLNNIQQAGCWRRRGC